MDNSQGGVSLLVLLHLHFPLHSTSLEFRRACSLEFKICMIFLLLTDVVIAQNFCCSDPSCFFTPIVDDVVIALVEKLLTQLLYNQQSLSPYLLLPYYPPLFSIAIVPLYHCHGLPLVYLSLILTCCFQYDSCLTMFSECNFFIWSIVPWRFLPSSFLQGSQIHNVIVNNLSHHTEFPFHFRH